MLTGRRAFDAASETELAVAIREHEPAPLAAQSPAYLPRSTGSSRPASRRTRSNGGRPRRISCASCAGCGTIRTIQAAPAASLRNARRAAVAAAALAAGLLVVAAIGLTRQPPPASRVSFSISPPEGTKFPRGTAEMAVSPDGSRLVFVAISADGNSRLWLRRFDAVESRPIDGSDGAHHPFWSPDGRSIAFFAHNKLKRIAEAGGLPQDICEVDRVKAAAPGAARARSCSASSGIRSAACRDRRRADTRRPSTHRARTTGIRGRVPAGRAALPVPGAEQRPGRDGGISGDPRLDGNPAGVRRRIPCRCRRRACSDAQQGAADRAAYDADRAQIGAKPRRSRSALPQTPRSAREAPCPRPRPAWWLQEREPGQSPDLVRSDRQETAHSRREPTTITPGCRRTRSGSALKRPTPRPEGTGSGSSIFRAAQRPGCCSTRPALTAQSGRPTDAVSGLDRTASVATTCTRLRQTAAAGEAGPQFEGGRPGSHGLVARRTISPVSNQAPGNVRHSCLAALACSRTAGRSRNVGGGNTGEFSPDVRWIAYTSNESGSPEVYVRAFPDAGARWQVSVRGGAQPRWRRDGKELFYLALDGRLMAVSVNATPTTIETGPPRPLFDTGIRGGFLDRRNQYLVTKDGQRFLVNLSAEDRTPRPSPSS